MHILAIDKETGKETYNGSGDFTEEKDPRDKHGKKNALFLNFGGINTLYESQHFFMGTIEVEVSDFTSEELGMIQKIKSQ